MSSSISIHIPFIVEIIDFLVLFYSFARFSFIFRGKAMLCVCECVSEYRDKALGRMQEHEMSIKHLWLTMCFNIFQRGNDERIFQLSLSLTHSFSSII
jgi:hypothetical protein